MINNSLKIFRVSVIFHATRISNKIQCPYKITFLQSSKNSKSLRQIWTNSISISCLAAQSRLLGSRKFSTATCRHLGFNVTLTNLMKNYFNNRMQLVKYKSSQSGIRRSSRSTLCHQDQKYLPHLTMKSFQIITPRNYIVVFQISVSYTRLCREQKWLSNEMTTLLFKILVDHNID